MSNDFCERSCRFEHIFVVEPVESLDFLCFLIHKYICTQILNADTILITFLLWNLVMFYVQSFNTEYRYIYLYISLAHAVIPIT